MDDSKITESSSSSSEASETMEDDQELMSDLETEEVAVDVVTKEQKMEEYHKSCQSLITYLKTKKIPNSAKTAKNYIRNIKNQAKKHVWDKNDKKLYYIGKKGRRIEVLSNYNDIDKVIRELHVKSNGTHLGINSSLSAISCKYMWANMKSDITAYVKTCYFCKNKKNAEMRKRDPIELVQVDIDEEFTYEATVKLIESAKKHAEKIYNRQARVHVFKEIQEDLKQQGYDFSVRGVRRKWNHLHEMKKRMSREIYQKNPPWEFYKMIENIEEGITSSNSSPVCKESYPAHKRETVTSYPQQEPIYPTHHPNAYTSNDSQGNLYAPHHDNNPYTGHHTSGYNVPQVHPFSAQSSHHPNPNLMTWSHEPSFIKNDTNQFRMQIPHNNPVRSPHAPPPPPPPPMATHLMMPSVNHQPILQNIGREVERLEAQQAKVHHQPKDVSVQNMPDKNDSKESREKFKLKHLKKITKELEAITQAQTLILKKQDQLLNAIMKKL